MKKLLTGIVWMLLFTPAFAQMENIKGKVQNGYDFIVNLPDGYEQAKDTLPLVFFLHGKSLSGSNLEVVKRYGVIDAIERKRKIPAVVIAPQCPRGSSWNPDKLLNVLNYVQKTYRYDTNRVYLTGMSMGGYGVFNFAGKYPEKFAAAFALCGGGNPKDACRLSTIPLWVGHGQRDVAVRHSESVKMVDAIRACSNKGSLLRFSSYPDLDHGDMAQVFHMDEHYRWLFMFSRKDSLKALKDTIDIPESRFRGHPTKTNKSYEKDSVKKTQTVYSGKETGKATGTVYVVKSGDTLYKISKKYGTTVEHLCKLNGISKTSTLRIGQRIKVK
ncbi:MAG: LysM peptidoglycan-binding domain-containing protein [Bacteroidota bacterium]